MFHSRWHLVHYKVATEALASLATSSECIVMMTTYTSFKVVKCLNFHFAFDLWVKLWNIVLIYPIKIGLFISSGVLRFGEREEGGVGSCIFFISCNLIFYCKFICQGSCWYCWYYWNFLSLKGLLWINKDNYISTCSEILCNFFLLNSFSRLPPM